jgi:cell division inhibitor SepF
MASMWQKTLFYLGLVADDDSEHADDGEVQSQSQVRKVEPPRRIQRPEQPRTASPSRQTVVPRGTGVVAGRRVEPPTKARRRISGNPSHAEAGVYVSSDPVGRQLPPPGHEESAVIVARTFSDAQQLADHIRSDRPVVLDLRGTEPAMVRRLVDFSTGLTYALDGRMAKIGQGVILVTPPGMTLEPEERLRLAELGLYQAPLGE